MYAKRGANYVLRLKNSSFSARNERGTTYFSSLSSSPNLSKYIEPQIQARFPRITTIVEELTARNIPVPPPHSNEWLTVSQTLPKNN